MKTHLVTGGSGFFGSILVQIIIDSGDNVKVIDLIQPTRPLKGVEYIIGNILDTQTLKSALIGVDIVHHAAASVPLAKSRSLFFKNNTLATENICKLIVQSNVKHVNLISSSAVYGKVEKHGLPITENTTTKPFDDYGRSKLESEKIALELFEKNTNITFTILRPRTILGPGRLGIMEILFNWVSHRSTIFMIGSGDNLFQLLHASDLAKICYQISDKKIGGIFNVGTDHFGSMNQLLENLCIAVGSKAKILHVPISLSIPILYLIEKMNLIPFGSWHYQTIYRSYYFETSKLQSALNYKFEYSNDRMVLETYRFYLENLKSVSTEAGSTHSRPVKRGILRYFMK